MTPWTEYQSVKRPLRKNNHDRKRAGRVRFQFTNTFRALDGATTVFGVRFNFNVEIYIILVGQISVFPHVTAICAAYVIKHSYQVKMGGGVTFLPRRVVWE
jgi:hypothetical protein